jgi:hypothetical protein
MTYDNKSPQQENSTDCENLKKALLIKFNQKMSRIDIVPFQFPSSVIRKTWCHVEAIDTIHLHLQIQVPQVIQLITPEIALS